MPYDPTNLTELNGRLYFSANDGETGNELWVSDGTAEGTQLLADINPEFGSISTFGTAIGISEFATFQDKLYFTANDGETGKEIWVSDGTSEGTQLLADINQEIKPVASPEPIDDGSYAQDFVEFNGKLYFSANDGINGRELWVTDGTTEGTQLVADINPLSSSYGYPYSSFPGDLTVVGDELFFSADNGETGTELFKLTFDDSTEEKPEEKIVVIDGTNGSDNLVGTDESEQIQGLNGKDTLDGGEGNDTLFGEQGADQLTGASGNDILAGANGSDFLDGGAGDDTLEGGKGDDTFVLRVGDGTDTILDFNLGSDRLGLASGLQFEDLTLTGNSILAGKEVLANLNDVDTENLTASDFELV